MIGILSIKEVDGVKKCFPILKKYKIDYFLQTWETLEQAEDYAKYRTSCNKSELLFIDIDSGEVIKKTIL